ncbi:uncharacterized protein A1O5_02426 [Cladophialophora psammophila CBS 110553]|uniref:Major facilitator superfamily (MFS) profile domain-containing protein n=1 Tax=Cladophialophora psammophila CBS 110553 TaxID=1182543 RepID=W9X0X7_9EURO|nr:uncharacterized protein A1O5_02426 [Cladophialophora psammophila CBS 110553]EXJ74132.1 hypothetical protein A1O5_02426 [Cladophialophora psammophila CBS 110553]
MSDLMRDAAFGQLMRWISGNRLFQYPEDKPDFQLPPQYQFLLEKGQNGNANDIEFEKDTALSQIPSRAESLPCSYERFDIEKRLEIERTKSLSIAPRQTNDGIILVDWYTTDDQDNPMNWSTRKSSFVIFLLCFYTWVVYIGSAIYAASEEGVMQQFGVGHTAASLPLSLYVLAYGIGPLLFAPLTEIPIIGRNSIYIITFVLFFIISIPTAATNSFAALLVLRFLQGFFGSPAVANAGASFGDWCWAAWAGPALGPVLSGFAVSAENWYWGLWEMAWMAAPVVIILFLFLPETSAANILLRRAQRLRRLTGSPMFQAQSELDQRNLTARSIAVHALVKPVEIMIKDPAIFFANMYTPLFYATYFTFFEVFPLVFPVMYEFNLGETGLAFVPCQIGATMGLLVYFAYLRWYMIPDNKKNGLREQEHRLVPGIFGSFFFPIGLFLFAWTARPDIHWTVPILGIVLFVFGTFFILQSIFVYVPLSYPRYAASLFAANDLSRSSFAAGSIFFARPLFVNLGVDKGVTVLASISVLGIFGMFALYYYGARWRTRSSFAQA